MYQPRTLAADRNVSVPLVIQTHKLLTLSDKTLSKTYPDQISVSALESVSNNQTSALSKPAGIQPQTASIS
jgi:hypothetical protein